ncbi:basic proline-rich protein-like [Balaenoptera musculus]|uniref:Basic proline-rich protein-like n=1 Tax=Balaenoptera musculus TaxID=9771 RepID=A0A8B8Y573_BALMU|nr:basic proline-rich protein-like [Balaenoptera musculus]
MEPPPAPPCKQPGQRQPAPPSARPRGRRAPHPSAPRSQPAVTQATGPGNFLPRGDHPEPGPAAKGTSFRTRKKISRRFPAGPLRPLRRPPGGQCRGNRLGLIPSPIPNNARKTRGFPALGAHSTTAAPPLGSRDAEIERSAYSFVLCRKELTRMKSELCLLES